MQQERWAVVNALFHAALELPPSDRRGFVLSASGDDSDLLIELEQLLDADERADSFLETPLVTPEPNASISAAPFQDGDLLNGRFQILRRVGEGGMGHVFEAHDNEVGVRVALKVIRSEIAGNPEALAFFRREVRTARTITHPNVCRTYDLSRCRHTTADGPAREFVFLTMEFLEGETLAAVLKRDGPIPPASAMDIARQIASALDAAHAAGIVHRDIKPANIMLVPPGRPGGVLRAVITDFGLARLDPVISAHDGSSISHGRGPIGTLAYMAPEQLEGGAVSPATDIYAFGLVLYEMASGQRAFPARALLSSIAQRLNGAPPSVLAAAPHLDPAWETAVSGCLRLNPADRFEHAGLAVDALSGYPSCGSLPQIQPAAIAERNSMARSASPKPRKLSRRMLLSVAAILLVAAVSLFFFFPRLYRAEDSRVADGTLVYLTPVKNQTGERSLDNLTELIQAGLTQSAHINLLDQSRVGDTLQLMTKAPDTAITPPIAREIAMRTGARRVIFATVSRSGSDYRLEVDIQQPDNTPLRPREHWPNSFTWRASGSTTDTTTIPAELLTVVRNSSDWIRNKAGESANDIARLDVPPEDVTTSNWQALEDYVTAEKYQARNETTKAVFALEHAVELDHGFALANGRLGDLLFSTGRYEDGLRAYMRALGTEEGQRLTRRERDLVLGEFSLDSSDFASAERAYRDITIFYPNDYRGWSYRGYPLMMMGRFEEAIATLKKAYSIDPTKTNAPWELARANVSIGNLPEALRWADALEQQGSSGLATYVRGAVRFLSNDYAGAASSFQAMQRSHSVTEQSWSFTIQARLAAEQGDLSGALARLQQGIEFDKQSGLQAKQADKVMSKAYVEQGLADYRSCIDDVRYSLQLEKSPLRLMVASSVLGTALFKASGPTATTLRQEIVRLDQQFPQESFGFISDLARLRVHGEVLLASGDVADAILQFRKASELDAPANGREYLARAFEAAAAREPIPTRAADLRRSAMKAYGATALRPALLWLGSVDIQPGYYTAQRESYRRVAGSLRGARNLASALPAVSSSFPDPKP